MTTPVVVPADLWAEDERTGSVILWLRPDGALVREGDLLAEVLVEKVTLELEAPAAGHLQILVQPESIVHKGDIIALIA